MGSTAARWSWTAAVLPFLLIAVARAHTGPEPAHEAPPAAPSEQSAFDEEKAFAASQEAIGRKLGDHVFSDARGGRVRLADLAGKPLVVSMVYTSCYHVCPTLTNHLAKVVRIARDALGEDAFSVLTVGFDTAVDTPQQMAMFAAERGIDSPHWRFVSADHETASALAAELGFEYRASASGFDHITQTTLVDAGGIVRNQVYGPAFDPPLLVEALKRVLRGEAIEQNTLQGWWRGIKLLCTVYDPSSGRYHLDYSVVIALVMGLSALALLGAFIVRSWRATARSLKPDLDRAGRTS